MIGAYSRWSSIKAFAFAVHVMLFTSPVKSFKPVPVRSKTMSQMTMKNTDASESNDGGCDRRQWITSSSAILGSVALSQGLSQPGWSIGELPEFSDDAKFIQHMVVRVEDMDAALEFCLKGLQMSVLRTRLVDGINGTFVGYGPEQLSPPEDFIPGVSSFARYGGHFSLELVSPTTPLEQRKPFANNPGTALQYIQLAAPNLSFGKLIKAGGIITGGYGYADVIAPFGLPFRVFVADTRDPAQYIAMKVKDMKKSIAYYEKVLGMKKLSYEMLRVKDSSFEPIQPKGSVVMGYNENSCNILLIPATRQDTIEVGNVFAKLAIVTNGVEDVGKEIGASYIGLAGKINTRIAKSEDPDGYGIVLVEYEDFMKEL